MVSCLSPLRLAAMSLAVLTLACERSTSDSAPPPAPASGAPAAEAPSTPPPGRTAPVSLDDRGRWNAVLKWPSSCEDAFQASHAGNDGGLTFSELTPGLSFVEVLCAAGSYQPSHVYLRLDERGSSRVVNLLVFRGFATNDGTTLEPSSESELWGEAHLSVETQQLSVLSLSRQIGDCGIWSRYAIGTELPRLVNLASRLPCPQPSGPAAESLGGEAPRGWRPTRILR
jgi:hypothetical protein